MIDLIGVFFQPAPGNQFAVGNIIEVSLFLVGEESQRFIVCDIPFGWDPTKLRFVDDYSVSPLIMPDYSGWVSPAIDYTRTSEASPPADGDGMYYAYGQLGIPPIIVTEPMELARFQFEILEPFGTTQVIVIPEVTHYPPYPARPLVYGTDTPGMVVTGTLGTATLVWPVTGDFDGDGLVGAPDMALLLDNWGTISYKQNEFDLNGDGLVNGQDLAILFTNWG